MKTPSLNIRTLSLAPAVCVLCALVSSCAQTAIYNPTYVGKPAFTEAERVAGRVLVYTEKTDDDTPFVGPPTSFTGGGTKLTIPLGVIAREIAATVFGELFRDGATRSGTLDQPAGYRVIVRPRVSSFSYEYNQLKNLGFAITPTVVVTLEVASLDDTGKTLRKRSYESGAVEMPAYVISGSPGEEISRAAHKALFDLMTRAARDLRDDMRSSGNGVTGASGVDQM